MDRTVLVEVGLRVAGMACLVAAAFVVSLVAGFAVLGLALLAATYLP